MGTETVVALGKVRATTANRTPVPGRPALSLIFLPIAPRTPPPSRHTVIEF
jgi:hypothetical protein